MTLEIFLQQSFLIIRFKNLMQLVNAGTTFMDLACRMAVDYPLKIICARYRIEMLNVTRQLTSQSHTCSTVHETQNVPLHRNSALQSNEQIPK